MSGPVTASTYDVYVANLPMNYTENQVQDIFDVAGEIAGVKIIPPKGDKNNGKIAFVKFLKEADAQCVAQYMSNYQLPDGRNLTVNYRPHQKSSPNKMVNGKDDEAGVAVPVDETVVIYVSHVASPIDFYGHTYNKELATKLDGLTKSMEALCPSQPKVIGQLSTEMMYGCKFSQDGMWYRCHIQKCLPQNEVKVLYIDYGNSEITNRFGLVTLPAEVLDLHPLCEFYRVDGLELIDKERTSELYVKGLDLFSSLISEQRIELKVIKKEKDRTMVNILKVLDGCVLEIPEKMITTGAVKKTVAKNDPIIQKVLSPGREKSRPAKPAIKKPSSPSPTSPDNELKWKEVGETNVAFAERMQPGKQDLSISHKNLLNEYAQKNSIPCPTYVTVPVGGRFFSIVELNGSQYEGLEIHVKRKDAEQDAAQVALNALFGIPLPSNQTLMTREPGEASSASDDSVQVYVSHVESPIHFWGQLYSTELEQKLLSLTIKLEEICPTRPKQTDDPPNGVYACQFSQDGLWYRCKVERTLTDTEVYVRYVDYGNSELTAKNNLVTLPTEIATISPLCTLYTVAGLELTNEESTSEVYREGVHALHDLIGEQKIQIQVTAKAGEAMVHVDKVIDGPLLDVDTGLIVNGAVRLKKKDGVAKPTPKSKMTFKGGDPDDFESFIKDAESNDRIRIKLTDDTASPEIKEVVVSDEIEIKTSDENENEDENVREIQEIKEVVVAHEIEIKTSDENENEDENVREIQEIKEVVVAHEIEIKTSDENENEDENVREIQDVDLKLEEYVKEIDKKRYEIEELKKKLTAKTKLVDDYLKKIPTPGCKRDLWQLYEDSSDYDIEDVNITTPNQQTISEEKIPLNDIGSYKKEICELQDLIEGPLLHGKLFEDVGVQPARGILVCGPCGTGKSIIARGVADDVKAFVVELRGQSLICETAQDINKILCDAFELAIKKQPSIILIDGIDKIAPKEVTDKSRIIVSQLINLWCMLKKKPYILLATLNDDIDPALKGFGLFEREIFISAPNVHQRLDILSTLTKRMNLRTDVCLRKVAEETHGYVASDLATLCNIAGMQVVRRKMAAMKLRKDEGFLVDKTSISGGAFQSTISITVGMQDFKYAISASKPGVLVEEDVKVCKCACNDSTRKEVQRRESQDKIVSNNLDISVLVDEFSKIKKRFEEGVRTENSVNAIEGSVQGVTMVNRIVYSEDVGSSDVNSSVRGASREDRRRHYGEIMKTEDAVDTNKEKAEEMTIRTEIKSEPCESLIETPLDNNDAEVVSSNCNVSVLDNESIQINKQLEETAENAENAVNAIVESVQAMVMDVADSTDSMDISEGFSRTSLDNKEAEEFKDIIVSHEVEIKTSTVPEMQEIKEVVVPHEIEIKTSDENENEDESVREIQEIKEVVVAHEIEIKTSDESENEDENVREIQVIENYTYTDATSDSEIEALNESFESCDSSLEEGEMIDHTGVDNVNVSNDVLRDEPTYQDGDEFEGWNSALLNKKTRNPMNAPSTVVEYTNGEDFF